MEASTVFEWSVGIGAWMSLATIVLVSGMQKTLPQYVVWAGIPLIVTSLTYVAVLLFLATVQYFIATLFLMVRVDVLVGLFILLTLAGLLKLTVELLEQFYTHPETLSPTVLQVVQQLDVGITRAKLILVRVYGHIQNGTVREAVTRLFSPTAATAVTAATAATVATAATAATVATVATAVTAAIEPTVPEDLLHED